MEKRGQVRYDYSGVDIFSVVLFLLGIYVSSQNNVGLGILLIVLAIIKQFSGR